MVDVGEPGITSEVEDSTGGTRVFLDGSSPSLNSGLTRT